VPPLGLERERATEQERDRDQIAGKTGTDRELESDRHRRSSLPVSVFNLEFDVSLVLRAWERLVPRVSQAFAARVEVEEVEGAVAGLDL